MNLPDGLSARPLGLPDASAVTAVMAADELATTGHVMIEEADIVADWSAPGVDVADTTIGVFEGAQLLGYAELGSSPGRGDAAVHPEHLGRGIGTWVATWMQERARRRGDAEIGMSVAQDSPAERLLRQLGYEDRWDSWVLSLPADRLEAPVVPPALVLREAVTTDDRTALWTVLEDAFLEWSVRPRESFEDFLAHTVGRPGFEPWNLRLVATTEGTVLGGTHVVLSEDGSGYVNKVAVRKGSRGQGLARMLLADAFGAARDAGATRFELNTDSRTGALGLYLGLGMEVVETRLHLAKVL